MPCWSTARTCAVVALAAGGCSAPVVDDVADASGGMTQAIVLVERVASGDGSTQTNVSAKFMRVTPAADPDLTERVVGSRLDLPPLGACMPLASSGAADDPALSAVASIDLFDVGDVALRAGGASIPLAARAFPDVGDMVSGVFYTSRDAALDLPAPARYVVEASGSAAAPRFALEAEAPPPPADVRVSGAPLADGVRVDARDGVLVSWRAADAPAADARHDDLVFVDVASPSSGAAVRCAFPDTGEGFVPPSFTTDAALGAAPGAGRRDMPATVAVHRVRLGSFYASGIDFGEIRFDVAVVARATLDAASAASARADAR